MANLFIDIFSAPDFKLVNVKESAIAQEIISASKLCDYINKFLPHKFTTNHGKCIQSEDSENETSDKDKSSFDSRKLGLAATEKTSRAKTIEELHKRIETLRGKKANYKEKLLKKGLKNRLKKKQKLEERNQQKKKRKKLEKTEGYHLEKKSDENETILMKEQPKENNIQFNKIVFSQSDNLKKQESDPKSLLAKLEKKKMKLKKLELKGKREKLTEIKSKESWDTALQKAEGMKVKDDVELLKKSLAKIKNRKNRSKKKWEEREKLLKSKKEEVQKKRQDNINKKKKERSKKRTKILVKKGRIIPK